MILRNRKEASDRRDSFLITAVTNIFIQTKIQIDGISVEYFHIVEKIVTFLNEGTFTLASSVEDVPVILNKMTYRVSGRLWLI